jgi:predicted deacylase
MIRNGEFTMKKHTILLLFLCLCLTLCGCGKRGLEQEPDQWRLEDFDGCMTEDLDSNRDVYLLAEGTEEENTVVVLQGKEDGPVIYIVAGVHGDEQAGWRAGNLLKEATIHAGTVYIVSPANRYGAKNDQRRTKESWDLNRSFPGDPEGGDAQRIAHAIFADIQDKQPDLVLDLHEAQPKEDDYEKLGSNYDALGNSIICHSLDGIGEMVLDAMLASEAGKLCSSPLTLYGTPPIGSVNQTVTQELGVPTITVETLRSEPLAQRVRNQLELVEFILNYYDMR